MQKHNIKMNQHGVMNVESISLQGLNQTIRLISHIQARFDYIAAEHLFGNSGPMLWRKFNNTCRGDAYKFITLLNNEQKLTLIEWYNKNTNISA